MDYSQLSLAIDEFRLLRIEPSSEWNADIACHLEQTALGSAQDYVALSYCWGEPTVKRRILVNNKPTRVTVNLSRALRALRMRGYLYVWADALCIDQSNPEERSQQVLRMGAIYHSASKVVTYLACPHPADAKLLSTVFQRILKEEQASKQAQKDYENLLEELATRKKSIWSRFTRGANEEPSKPQPFRVKLNTRERDTLENLLKNPYWRRAWIMQEISANVNLEIL